jgi:putative membrane protein
MAKQTAAYLIVGSLAIMSVQCGGDKTQASQAAPLPPPEPMPAEPSMTPAARTTPPAAEEETPPPADTQAAPEQPAAPEKQALSDEQIAAVTDAANDAEVAQAKIAQKNAKNPRVKKFAAMMIKDHTQAKQKQKKLLGKIDITAAESSMSTQLASDSQQKLEDLKAVKGADFDRAYMDAQVDAHQKVLDAFDNQLIPQAENAEFKALLSEIRPKIAAHLSEAKDIQQALLDASSGPSTGKQGESSDSKSGTKANETTHEEHQH